MTGPERLAALAQRCDAVMSSELLLLAHEWRDEQRTARHIAASLSRLLRRHVVTSPALVAHESPRALVRALDALMAYVDDAVAMQRALAHAYVRRDDTRLRALLDELAEREGY